MYGDDKKHRQIKLALYGLVIITLLLIIFGFIKAQKFHVVSTNPPVNAVSSVAPFFKINFNKTLIASSVKISSYPNVIGSYTVDGKTIDVSLLSLNLAVPYRINVVYAESTNHAVIKNQVFYFVTKDISANDLPKDQQQAILKNQQVYPTVESDPIIKDLPHATLNYTLTAHIIKEVNNQSKLVLEAQIQLSQADNGNQAAAVANYKQQIISYIQSLGLDPNNYTIDYTVSNL